MYGSPGAVIQAGPDELRRTAGVAATQRLMAAVRLGELLAESGTLGKTLTSPAEAARFLMAAGAHLRPLEEFDRPAAHLDGMPDGFACTPPRGV
jgi:hypothetical protein